MESVLSQSPIKSSEDPVWKIVLIQGATAAGLLYICLFKGYGVLVAGFFGILLIAIPIFFQPKIGLILAVALNITSASAFFLGGVYMGAIALTIGAWVLRSIVVGQAFARAPQNRLILALTAIIFFSLIRASDLGRSYQSLDMYIKVVVFYFVLINLIDTSQMLKVILWVITISAFFIALYGLIQFVSAPPVVGVLNRIASTKGDANNLALTLVSAIPFSIALFKIEKNIISKAILGLSTAIILFTVPLTFSRGGLLALIVVLFLLVSRIQKKRYAIFILLLFVGLSVLILPTAVWERASMTSLSSMDASIQMRTRLLRGGLAMFLDHPIFGVGIGNFIVHSYHYSGVLPPSYAHNMFLHVAAELGILGLFFFAALLWITWRMLRQVQKATSGETQPFLFFASQGIEISLIGFCVATFFLSQQFNKMLWILIALSVCVKRLYEMSRDSGAPADITNRT